jgi:dinuclear metal center YbgI/SA1388 family protein
MTQSVGEIAEQLFALLGFDKAAAWDPVGLQLGDPDAAVAKTAVCHEIDAATVQRLIDENIDLAVVYHPLLFHSVKRLVAGSGAAGRAHRLIANGVALVVAHTAFDVMAGGTADALANTIGLRDATGFGPAWGVDSVKVVTFVPAERVDTVVAAMAAAGAGRIGRYSSCSFQSAGTGSFLPESGADPFVGEVGALSRESELRVEMVAPASRVAAVIAAMTAVHPYEEPAYDVIEARSNAGFVGRQGRLDEPMTVEGLAEWVADRLGGVLRVAGSGPVSTAAVVPGSGGSFLLENDADVVITGDVGHHEAMAALANGKAVIDPGHIATERPGVKALYASVAESVPNVIDMTDTDPDPWKEP